jgi:hypothetical protein
MARALFAVGHMLPSFALLLVAAGVGLLVEEEPPSIAYWLPCIGIGMYLPGTREDEQRYFGSRPPRRSGTSSRQGR